MADRPNGLNPYQLYVASRLDELGKQIGDLRGDVGRLQGRARAWGAIPGVAAVLIAVAAYFKN